MTRSGVPFLAPEIVLLFKAKRSRATDERDFEVTVPLMTEQQTDWLVAALEIEHPDHHWLRELET